jgi:hypothetical protein
MITLVESIITTYNNDATGLKSGTLGMYTRGGEPTLKSDGVYLLLVCPVTTRPDYTMQSDYEYVTADFHIIENSQKYKTTKNVLDIAEKLKTKYVDNYLTVSGYTVIRADKKNETDLGELRTEQDVDMTTQHYVVSIRYYLQKT